MCTLYEPVHCAQCVLCTLYEPVHCVQYVLCTLSKPVHCVQCVLCTLYKPGRYQKIGTLSNFIHFVINHYFSVIERGKCSQTVGPINSVKRACSVRCTAVVFHYSLFNSRLHIPQFYVSHCTLVCLATLHIIISFYILVSIHP